MNPGYDEWLATVPEEVRSDFLWRMEAVRLSAWAGALAVQDAKVIHRMPGGLRSADQLVRAVGSVGANLWEGLSRTSAGDRARYVTYALGSVREGMSWYLLVRPTLSAETLRHRMSILAQIRRMLVAFMRNHDRRPVGK